MDIRARLLLAFVPLLVVVVGIGALFTIFSGDTVAGIALQRERTDDLIDTQEIAIAVFLEHDIVGHIASGEEPPDSARYRESRAAAEELIAGEAGEATTAIDDDQAVSEQYTALARYHDEIVAAAAAGDLEAAEELFERPEVDVALERIVEVSGQTSAATREAIAAGDAATEQATRRLGPISTLILALSSIVALVLAWMLIQQVAGPLNRLAADAERFAAGDLAGELSPAGNITQIRRLRDSFQQLIDANRERQSRVQAALDELQQQVSREEHLRETVHALSVPVVPLTQDTLLLPLVGYLDERRSAELTRGLLEAVQARRARAVVLDLTGLAELDRATAERLRQAAEGARLLGCRVTLVGVRAEQALALSDLNLTTSGVEIARDIPAVLRNGNVA